MEKHKNIPFRDIDITGGFWAKRQRINRERTIYSVYDRFRDTGRFDAFKCDWADGVSDDDKQPHIFWDSDVAKWMESAAYIISKTPDKRLEAIIDETVDLIEKNQDECGYFNIYFTVIEKENRFVNRDAHELYCAGHLMEAAVAYYHATGKDKFLKLMCAYADYIEKAFKTEGFAEFKTCGHPEIELALVKLYNATGEKRYLDLSLYFLECRGAMPEPPCFLTSEQSYNQSHLPIRKQTTAEGHAVRACYLYSGMADMAYHYGDESIFAACRAIFGNITEKRMYITGGIGSSSVGEAFTVDYDLPNATAYAETCAAIALIFFASRMSRLETDSKYGDTVERILYNGFLSGISLDGKSFFYENPLEINKALKNRHASSTNKSHEHFPAAERQEVFGCSCCPPNVTRLIASAGDFIYNLSSETVYVEQYMESEAVFYIDDRQVKITQKTDYPYNGNIKIVFENMAGKRTAFRIPGWCSEYRLAANGTEAEFSEKNGYAVINIGENRFEAELSLLMELKIYESHPKVTENAGKGAVTLGPLVFCAEECDNGENLRDIRLLPEPGASPYELEYDRRLGCYALRIEAFRTDENESSVLYIPSPKKLRPVNIKLIPYFAFANRDECDMLVWFNLLV
ncbi:MAG: glycoside hydrolase family 127 protein [Oscillospiraceae bacterium]|nr:glycoside hydrolase family 127 protein [Oscillospiraceae bacterium]